MNKDSKIYVGGHTGLLGTALLKKLELEGYRNIITKTSNELDLINQERVKDFFNKEQPEYVFLCAGLTGGIIANKTYPATFLHTNIAIQDNVFEAAQRHGVKHLIFYGSSCMYPKYSPQPIKEDYLFDGKIEETSEAYAIAKIAGVIACKSYNIEFNTKRFIALVPNTMFGPHDNFDPNTSHVIPSLIRKFHEAKEGKKENVMLWGSGNPRREFVFSEDVADASIFAMLNADKLENGHYNIGTSEDYSIKELANMIASIVGNKGEIFWDVTKPDGSPRKLLDSSKFLTLGRKPLTTLEKGLKITYEWFLKNGKKY
ncbi:GDP-L-fucose synthase [Candidatus Kuenenia stuttgartiensis]|uniref:GDP-L-fucose synthase n=1 Tax=Kuenenia stuttgartiensis TaxID=174633 RepID=A0A6G7GXR4_KUEST|nr:GDP-L-fucose synthase [Candidatus Kuenenia stuttgartiensis]QII14144.1 GDP-L-fucose synthase [Candidatus Kuenenia stuttgartiensis]